MTTPSNRGVEIPLPAPRVAVDWIGATLHQWQPREVAALVDPAGASTWWSRPGKYGYESALTSDLGASALFRSHGDNVHLEVPGAACERLGLAYCTKLVGTLLEAGAHFTRIDLALTDVECLVELSEVRAGIERGEHVTHVKTCVRHHGLAGTPGETITLGAPTSPQLLRIYDKEAQLDKAGAGVRWELQVRKPRAGQLARELVAAPSAGTAFAAALVRLVDFREPSERPVDRRVRSPWFERIVGSAGRAGAFPRKPRLVDQRDWLMRQGARAFYLVVEEEGWEFAEQLFDLGANRSGVDPAVARQRIATPRWRQDPALPRGDRS